VAWALPPTYVFEGMRALLSQNLFRPDLMLYALALNAVFFAAGVFAFLKLLQSARRHGSLMPDGRMSFPRRVRRAAVEGLCAVRMGAKR